MWNWQSDAFGVKVPVANQPNVVVINLRFPGQYYDMETGLYYNYHRYYDPQTGRYVSSDPIGLAGGLNTFGYVGGNPLRFVDPLGLLPDDFYVAEDMMREVFKGRNIPSIVSCDHCEDVHPFNEGIYDPDKNRIVINEYDFGNGGNLWNDVLTDAQATSLLHVHFHEMIHANQSLFSQLIIRYFENMDGTGIGNKLHARIDYWAQMLAKKYSAEFNMRRKNAAKGIKNGANKCD